jgi:organic hydroperoxide reductase OsmC/OhrA
MTTHSYELTLTWTGNRGRGTAEFRGYARDHEVRAAGKPALLGSSDPSFRGDPTRWNPEELLVASLSQCHMLWYLHLAAVNGVVVTAYTDEPRGTMEEDSDGAGRFTSVVLRPHVSISAESQPDVATRLHDDAHAKCFIANSVNFPVRHEPTLVIVAWAPDRARAEVPPEL